MRTMTTTRSVTGMTAMRTAAAFFGVQGTECTSADCANRSLWRSVMDRKKGIRLEGHWLCSPACFERAILEIVTLHAYSSLALPNKDHRVPIGLLLMDLGVID